MKKLIAILLSLCIYNSNVYAMGKVPDPTPTPTPIPTAPTKPEGPFHLTANKPFTPTVNGWFFTEQQEQKIRFRLIDADYLEREFKLTNDLLEGYKKINETQEQISERYKKAYEDSNNKLTEVLKREGRTKFWYITLGVLLTVGAGLAIGFSAKAIK